MKKAYTLSEVLVVLGVLGLICAFVLPAVMRSAPDRAALLYRKSFYATQEAAKKLINDTSLYPEHDDGTPVLFTDNGGANFCSNFAQKMNISGLFKCQDVEEGKPNFTTTNGVEWYGFNGGFEAAGYKDIKVKCNNHKYKIRIYANGRVGTGKSSSDTPTCNYSSLENDSWDCENIILKKPLTLVNKENR